MQSFTICLQGAPNTGKSCYKERVMTGHFLKDHVPTKEANVGTLVINTDHGDIEVHLVDGNLTKCDGILLFRAIDDHSPSPSYNVPTVVVGSKYDLINHGANWNNTTTEQYSHLRTFDHFISSKSMCDLERPLLSLLQKLTNQPQLRYVETPI